MVVVVSGIHCLLVRCFRRARAQKLARGAALVSGVLPSGVLKKERGGRSCSRAMRSNWPRRQRVLAAVGGLPRGDPKKVENSIELAV